MTASVSTSLSSVRLRPSIASLASASTSTERRKAPNPLLFAPSSSPASAADTRVSFAGASSSCSSSARLVAAALQHDPSIFQYDTDENSSSSPRSQAAAASSASAGSGSVAVRPASRYIDSLVRAASAREKHRTAVQHTLRVAEIEREEQMGEFRGKERFITAAYKQQLSALQRGGEAEGGAVSRRADEAESPAAAAPEPAAALPGASATTPKAAPLSPAAQDERASKRRRVASSDTAEADARATEQAVDASEMRAGRNDEGSGSVGSANEERKRATARARFLARRQAAAQAPDDG